MSNIKISHEVPLCLLKDSKAFNDYQYALVHLLEEEETYRDHFIQCSNEGIPIYLDNSLHEKGYAIGGDILLKWIKILKPQYVFIPDVWENMTSSIVNAKEWVNIELPQETSKIAVVQAKTIEEAMICYQTYKDLGYNKIAFSYGATYYNNLSSHPNPDIGKALGRIQIISHLYKNGIISSNDNIHLLGCAIPLEFWFYKDMPFIKSLDTSNPIMASIQGMEYNSTGLRAKPTHNMNSHTHMPVWDIDLSLIKDNVKFFRNILN